MAKITIIYGSTMGNTETAAEAIATKLASHTVKVINVSDASTTDFEDADLLILGSSTWGDGELQDDWYDGVELIKSSNIAGKRVAIFGCGDAYSYSETFVDAMSIIYEAAIGAGAEIVGKTSTDGYDYSDSRSVVDGEFVGLALDDSSCEMNDSRIENWVSSLNDTL